LGNRTNIMSRCHVSEEIAKHCNEPREDECQVCGFSVDSSMEGGYEILICADDKCGHKVWADGDEY